MPNLARTWSNRTLRIRQRALVETACRGEAYALQVLPQAFRGPVPILSLRSVSGEVLRIFLVGRDVVHVEMEMMLPRLTLRGSVQADWKICPFKEQKDLCRVHKRC